MNANAFERIIQELEKDSNYIKIKVFPTPRMINNKLVYFWVITYEKSEKVDVVSYGYSDTLEDAFNSLTDYYKKFIRKDIEK
jgi:hypothetical protein